jgi:type II secretory pathway pseudopilin PulG
VTEAGSAKPRRGLAIASLVLGILGLPTIGLVGVGALIGIVLGVVALVNASREPARYGGKGMAIAGIALSVVAVTVMPMVLGIVAAIAIPSFLRARVSANEAAAIGDVRTVISAQAHYQTINGGYFGPIECLAAPGRCVPSYSGPPLLPADLAAAVSKQGYRRTFHAGPVAGGTLPAGVSPSSLTSFAYVAVPVTAAQTGVRSFCGDATGRICYEKHGSEIRVVGGVCPDDCESLR